MRLNADLESGRSFLGHPRRKAGKGAVKLVHNEKRGAASLKPPPNAYRLAEARMKSVGDVCFSLLFAGSMSPFRGGVVRRASCQSCDRSEWLSFAASNECQRRSILDRRCQPSDAPAGNIGESIGEGGREVGSGRDIESRSS